MTTTVLIQNDHTQIVLTPDNEADKAAIFLALKHQHLSCFRCFNFSLRKPGMLLPENEDSLLLTLSRPEEARAAE